MLLSKLLISTTSKEWEMVLLQLHVHACTHVGGTEVHCLLCTGLVISCFGWCVGGAFSGGKS